MLRDKKATVELENAGLKIKNMEVTYQQLKQQIHPHFLFNSLSTLKSMIRKQPDNAEDYLVKLSDFLRASLLSGTPHTVVLSEELKLCDDYLAMQKLRFADSLQYAINIPQEVQHVACVPVFSLLSLLENAVKHNNFTSEAPLRIQIHYVSGRIITSNNIQRKLSPEVSTRLGLANLTERYRILGGDDVVIGNDGTTFFVSMGTLSNENSNHRG
jgi:LytS/YehU family sensor histidine kinase